MLTCDRMHCGTLAQAGLSFSGSQTSQVKKKKTKDLKHFFMWHRGGFNVAESIVGNIKFTSLFGISRNFAMSNDMICQPVDIFIPCLWVCHTMMYVFNEIPSQVVERGPVRRLVARVIDRKDRVSYGQMRTLFFLLFDNGCE